MDEFWENKFREIGLLWQFEPADASVFTFDLFKKNNIRKILIPGIGYGRNARIFAENGFDVTGIEISETAIRLARENDLDFPIHHGSVNQMPFDEQVYDGIFCYALIHLLDQNERQQFLKSCWNQLKIGGVMVFAVVSKEYRKVFGNGKLISKDRYQIENGLTLFYYDSASIETEFGKFGLIEFHEMDEPVKHMKNAEPMNFFYVVCQKSSEN